MGDARDALDAVTVAPSGFGDWAGIVSDQSDAVGAVSVTAEGMDPSNSAAVNTTAFNNAIAKAGRNGKVVFDKSGTYQINAAIDLPYAGLTVEGSNGAFVRIQQVTTNTHGFRLIPDTTYDFTNAIGVTLRNLRIIGPGAGTTGVGIWSDPASGIYQGAKLTIDDVRVDSFDIGVRLHRFDNSLLHNVHVQSCRVGYWTSGNANSIHMDNVTASTISECCIIVGDGAGITIRPGDLINSAKMIRVLVNGKATVIGGNFEACTGSEGHIDIETNGALIGIGNRFLKGSVETPAYRVNQAQLIVVDASMAGFTTAPVVKKFGTDVSAVQIFRSTGLSGTQRTLEMTDGSMVSHAQFINRIDNSVPAAAVEYRGLALHKVARSSVSAEDALYFYTLDRSSGSNVYSQRVMTNVIEGTGSPEGAVTARVGTYFARRDGGSGTTLYVKESGTGNTGWSVVGFPIRAVQTSAPSTTGWRTNDLWYDTSTES